ncbi:hypothetical protein [Actinomyces howellii]|uniref:Uncharacterized protein n=1 Tax=Actinomyces howellii TaxID=52771 RepID=A0A3S4R3A3_9ACTO|nr:hypothetical protein [Actinomyces howellii]VEG28001.1 Uncharacterised protein [Actinomyces howellii]
MARQFHRPARLDPEVAESIEGSADTAVSSELAHRAAQALVGGFVLDDPDGSDGSGDGAASASEVVIERISRAGVVEVVATRGVDEVAELWADSPSTTLPGALWRLFLVREWIRRDPELVARRYATTVDLSAEGPDSGPVLRRFEAARAEGRPAPSPEQLRARIDEVLAGRLEDSVAGLAPVLTLASGFLRALAAGSDPEWILDDADELADRVTRRDSALLATASEMADAAARARAGVLD